MWGDKEWHSLLSNKSVHAQTRLHHTQGCYPRLAVRFVADSGADRFNNPARRYSCFYPCAGSYCWKGSMSREKGQTPARMTKANENLFPSPIPFSLLFLIIILQSSAFLPSPSYRPHCLLQLKLCLLHLLSFFFRHWGSRKLGGHSTSNPFHLIAFAKCMILFGKNRLLFVCNYCGKYIQVISHDLHYDLTIGLLFILEARESENWEVIFLEYWAYLP